MTLTRSGIPTTYRDTRFRSRLEARWAAFFDLVGWQWTYEPFDAEGWIPDFLIGGSRPFLVEIGPCLSMAELEQKSVKTLAHEAHPTLVLGAGPTSVRAEPDTGDLAGLMVNELPGSTGPAWWETCRAGELAVHGDEALRPCGHAWQAAPVANLESLWAQAGNVVQWKP